MDQTRRIWNQIISLEWKIKSAYLEIGYNGGMCECLIKKHLLGRVIKNLRLLNNDVIDVETLLNSILNKQCIILAVGD